MSIFLGSGCFDVFANSNGVAAFCWRRLQCAVCCRLRLHNWCGSVPRIFPPYTVRPESGADTGLLPQLVEALNQLQTDYQFVLVPTSIPRRFNDFKEGRVDMAIFENPDWGWKDIPHTLVDMGLEDAEIFVAQKKPNRDESYFKDLTDKRLALYSGYHYEFANFNADPKYLADTYKATLTYSHDSNLLMVLRARADIALVTRSYLSDYLLRNEKKSASNCWCPNASIRSITITR